MGSPLHTRAINHFLEYRLLACKEMEVVVGIVCADDSPHLQGMTFDTVLL
jgi:hypothetical protein